MPTRREAFATLKLYLQRGTAFEELELLKLWKGLFYCMWMTANPKPQQRLAEEYASLITDTIAVHNVLPFVDAFWLTLAREWGGIDSLRMNKFLRLSRLVLRASLTFLVRQSFKRNLLEEHNAILERTPLNTQDSKISNGLRYHVLDIFADELEFVSVEADIALDAEIVHVILQPIQRMSEVAVDRVARKRAAEALEDDRLKPDIAMESGQGEEDDEFEGFED